MKFQPIVFIKSFNWTREDGKKIIILIIMLLITCFIFDKFFPVIKVKIISGDVDVGSIGDTVTVDSPTGGMDINIRQ